MNAGEIPANSWVHDLAVGGGRIIGEACHYVDLMRFLAGSGIVGVQAGGMGAHPAVEVKSDKAVISLFFADGSFGTIHYLANGGKVFPKERIEVFAGDAVLQLDNFRKRYMKEKAELIKYGNESVLKEFLGILDNLERALSSAKRSKEMEPLIEGLELIIKQFEAILERFGVKSIEAKGRPFDPYVHEAIMHVESDEHPENTVLEEFQRGFTFHDRLLRPAKVSVSKKAESAEKNGD